MRALALVVVMSGCVPYAYVLPPLDVGADLSARASGSQVAPQVNVNIGVRPLALAPSLHERPNDFSLGYTVTATPAPLAHGPYGELSHVFWQHPTSQTHLWRFKAGVLGRLIYDTGERKFGAQGLLRAQIETSTMIDSDFSGADGRGFIAGHAIGEGGVGLYAESGILALPTQVAWTISFGVVFSIPASAGVGFAWIWS